MEKTKNGWYKAVSIIEYIFASIFVCLTALVLYVGLADAVKLAEALNEAQITGVDGVVIIFTAETAKSFTVAFSLMMLPTIIVMFVEAVMFGKYSNMTDQEAAERYKAATIWTIVAFFFGGTLIGVLALVGLLKIHSRQKERYLASAISQGVKIGEVMDETLEAQVKSETNANDQSSKVAKDDAKTAERLAKLEALKSSGAITDEEYTSLKDKILKK
ncbi:MAG: SHOCT domain-containing protein [Clostridia bacterium]|nr:SHOCT domain-containing protein [Clostridia bacterium]